MRYRSLDLRADQAQQASPLQRAVETINRDWDRHSGCGKIMHAKMCKPFNLDFR